MNHLDSLTIANSLNTNIFTATSSSVIDSHSERLRTANASFSNSITISQTTYSATQLEALFNHLLTLYPELSL